MTPTSSTSNDRSRPQTRTRAAHRLDTYRQARQTLLATLGLPVSNRDPLAEFSEQFVHAVLGGTLATSRVQVGHDLVQVDGRKVQVRYLANPGDRWVNEHTVHQITEVELYALVLFEAFAVAGVLVFPLDALAPICAALGKRHPRQDELIQFTRRNWWTIRDDADHFRTLGMTIWLPEPQPLR